MLNENCYGILSDDELIYNEKQLLKDLEEKLLYSIVHFKANSFIVGAICDYDDIALKVCRNLRKKYKSKNIKIKVVLTNIDIIKNPVKYNDILTKYEDVEILYAYNENNYEKPSYITNQFIVNNSVKAFAYVDDKSVNNISTLSTYLYTIINLYNNAQNSYRKEILDYPNFNENITFL